MRTLAWISCPSTLDRMRRWTDGLVAFIRRHCSTPCLTLPITFYQLPSFYAIIRGMARNNMKTHVAKSRAKIKTGLLINALHEHIMGKRDLSPTQVRSAEILLRKTVPDARDDGTPLQGVPNVVVQFGAPPETDDQ